MLARANDSVLLVVDLQEAFLAPIWESERVLRRTEFLLRVAKLLDVPIFATEQYPERMGQTVPPLLPFLGPREGKMKFSAIGCPSLLNWLEEQGRSQVVVVGIETHICVTQSVSDLLQRGYDPILVDDAVSARTSAMHENGIARVLSMGAAVAHSESVAYEWMGAADHPLFREMLAIVKAFG